MNELRLVIDQDKLALVMANLGVNASELAEKAGISRQTMHIWLKSRDLNAKQVNRLSNALGVQVKDLIK